MLRERLNPATMADSTQYGYSQITIVDTGVIAVLARQVGVTRSAIT